jgi:hypothetical protein
MDSRVLVEDTADLLDRLGRALRRVPGAHDQFGLDTVYMRALVLDDSVVTILDRTVAFHRNDRMGMHARGYRQRRQRL